MKTSLTQPEVVMLPLIGHEAALLFAPLHRKFVPEQKQQCNVHVGILGKDIGLGVVLEMAEVPPMGGCCLEVPNDKVMHKMVELGTLEYTEMAVIMLGPSCLSLKWKPKWKNKRLYCALFNIDQSTLSLMIYYCGLKTPRRSKGSLGSFLDLVFLPLEQPRINKYV